MGRPLASGGDRQIDGVLIVTSTRVVFYKKGLIGETLRPILRADISRFDHESILFGHYLLSIASPEVLLQFRGSDEVGFPDVIAALK